MTTTPNMLDALVRHYIDTPDTILGQIDSVTAIIEQAELLRARLVDTARSQGSSWAQIGGAQGISKQAAQQKYGPKPSIRVDDPQQMSITDADQGAALDATPDL